MHYCRTPYKFMRSIQTPQIFTDLWIQPRPAAFSSVATNDEGSTQPASEQNQTFISESVSYKNGLFDAAKKRQLADMVPRIEKIEVHYQGRGISDNAVMFMNKHISSPRHCAMHISKAVADSAVLALVTPINQGNPLSNTPLKGTEVVSQETTNEPVAIIWDIHRPLAFDCKLEILKFNMSQSTEWRHKQVNQAYWNSCALILGAVVQKAFKENYKVGVYDTPSIPVNRGAFCCDVAFDESLRNWNPHESDLIYFTKLARSIISKNLPFERLDVSPLTASEMFVDDPHRIDMINNIVASHGQETPITLYRCGDYIDVSSGPHISNTSLMYHYVVTAIHKLQSESGRDIRRMQGISLPQELRVHHAIWSMLEHRARKLIKEGLDHRPTEELGMDGKLVLDSIENKTKPYMISTGQWREGTWKETEEPFRPKSDS